MSIFNKWIYIDMNQQVSKLLYKYISISLSLSIYIYIYICREGDRYLCSDVLLAWERYYRSV